MILFIEGLCNNLANLGYHVFIIDYRGSMKRVHFKK